MWGQSSRSNPFSTPGEIPDKPNNNSEGPCFHSIAVVLKFPICNILPRLDAPKISHQNPSETLAIWGQSSRSNPWLTLYSNLKGDADRLSPSFAVPQVAHLRHPPHTRGVQPHPGVRGLVRGAGHVRCQAEDGRPVLSNDPGADRRHLLPAPQCDAGRGPVRCGGEFCWVLTTHL